MFFWFKVHLTRHKNIFVKLMLNNNDEKGKMKNKILRKVKI